MSRYTPTQNDISRANLIRRTMAGLHESSRGESGKPNARFGDVKVFIVAIWNALGEEADEFESYAEFKAWLVHAMLLKDGSSDRTGLVILARADLVSAMDPEAVRLSELTDRGATFHFVLDPGADETPPRLRILTPDPRVPDAWRTMMVSRDGR